MTRKTLDDWKNLVEKQIASGLSVPQFCDKHSLNPTYFYSRKSLVVKARDNASFIQAHVTTTQATFISTMPEPCMIFSTSAGELSLPASISAQFIVELINGLTS